VAMDPDLTPTAPVKSNMYETSKNIPFDAPMGYAVPLVPRRFSSVSSKNNDREFQDERRGSDVAAKRGYSKQRRRAQVDDLQPITIFTKLEETIDSIVAMDPDLTPTATYFEDSVMTDFKEPNWASSRHVTESSSAPGMFMSPAQLRSPSMASLGSTLVDNASLRSARPMRINDEQAAWNGGIVQGSYSAYGEDDESITSSETVLSQPKKRRGLLYRVLTNVAH